MRMILVALPAAALLTNLAGCGPAELLARPECWPEKWADRSLYHTQNAYIYASSAAAAGEADRLVSRCAKVFQDQHERRPAKGLVVVTDGNDGLFTADVESLLTIAAEGTVKPGTDEPQAQTIVKANLAHFRQLTWSLGVDVSLVHRVAALPLSRAGIGRLVGLNGEQTEELGWAIAIPTQSALRKALWDGAPEFLEKTCGIGPVAHIALAPLIPWAEAFAVKKVTQQWQEMVDGQMCLADPELAEATELPAEFASRPGVVIGNGPAPLQRGDRVLSVNGTPVEDPSEFLSTFIPARKAGDAVEMVVQRDGQEISLTVPPASTH